MYFPHQHLRRATLICLAAFTLLALASGCSRSPPAAPPKPSLPVKQTAGAVRPTPAEAAVPAAAPSVEPAPAVETPTQDAVQQPEPPPREPGDRLMLLAPGGPLILEVHVVIDGQSSGVVRGQLIDELLR